MKRKAFALALILSSLGFVLTNSNMEPQSPPIAKIEPPETTGICQKCGRPVDFYCEGGVEYCGVCWWRTH